MLDIVNQLALLTFGGTLGMGLYSCVTALGKVAGSARVVFTKFKTVSVFAANPATCGRRAMKTTPIAS
jgi:hypothetical protein